MTPDELKLFHTLLAKYLDMTCRHCKGRVFEDRHIVTCIVCGVVTCDLKDRVEVDTARHHHRHMMIERGIYGH